MEGRIVKIRITLIAAASLLSACVTGYQQPASNAASARLELKTPDLNAAPLGRPVSAEVYAFEDDQCTPVPSAGRLAYFNRFKNSPENISIAAGRRIYVRATSTGYHSDVSGAPGQVNVASDRCTRLLSFVPEAGKSYSLMINAMQNACPVSLVDTSTSVAPADLAVHPVGKTCALGVAKN
jgi:hypothetical protein